MSDVETRSGHAGLGGVMRALGPREATLVLAVALVALAGLADYITGDDTAFTLVYLVPVALAAWRSGRWPGLFVAGLSAASWLVVEHQRTVPLSPMVQAWNMATEIGVFVTVSSLLVGLKQRLELEAERGLTDPLTGLMNRRGFTAAAAVEFDRSRRHGHPLTIAFIDLDDFKLVNDRRGHEFGDSVLMDVAKVFRRRLRGVDVAARLGGDEFALLLSETDADQAKALLQSLVDQVVHHFETTGVPVALSMGSVTFQTPPLGLAEALRQADELMYEAKRDGKGRMRHKNCA